MVDRTDIERLYRMVADGADHEDILQEIYDLFGAGCNLRPPLAEQNLARMCRPKRTVANA